MPTEKYTTLGENTLASAYSSGGVSLVVANASSFPTTGNFRVRVADEIFKVTAVSGVTFTVVGAQEGTAAANHPSGSIITEVVTALSLDSIRLDMVRMGTLANLPASGERKQGDVYHATDSLYSYVFDGSAWVAFHLGRKVVPPVLADFTWVNQGSATTSTSIGGVYVTTPTSSFADFKVLKRAAPAAPFTIKMGCYLHLDNADCRFGVLLRESSTGKFLTWSVHWSDLSMYVEHMTNATAYVSTPSAYAQYPVGRHPIGPLYLYLTDEGTGTNHIRAGWYPDGLTKQEIHDQSSRTNFMAGGPDEVGFFIETHSGHPVAMTVFHWEVLV